MEDTSRSVKPKRTRGIVTVSCCVREFCYQKLRALGSGAPSSRLEGVFFRVTVPCVICVCTEGERCVFLPVRAANGSFALGVQVMGVFFSFFLSAYRSIYRAFCFARVCTIDGGYCREVRLR